jgi:hypothetical protein
LAITGRVGIGFASTIGGEAELSKVSTFKAVGDDDDYGNINLGLSFQKIFWRGLFFELGGDLNMPVFDTDEKFYGPVTYGWYAHVNAGIGWKF